MKRLYEPAAYDTSRPAGAWWEETLSAPLEFPPLATDITADVVIVGAGYTGLNAALQLVGEHGLSTVLLDAGQPGWGASGRNGGFACLGGAKLSINAQIKRFGLDETKRFQAAQLAAVDRVRDNLIRYDINADTHSQAGELCLAHSPRAFVDMAQEADFATKTFGLAHDLIPKHALRERGMFGENLHGAITIKAGFALNPLKYAQGLTDAAVRAGVALYGRSPVGQIRRDTAGYIVQTPDGTVRAAKVIIATNGYSSDDVPAELGPRFLPVLSSILVTRPISKTEQRQQGWTTDLMSYDSRHLLHYFRLMPDGRFLFGQRGARRADPAHTAANQRTNRRDFDRMFPAWRHIESTHYWSGLICTTLNRHPYVGPLEGTPGLFAALGYHGNGVTMASHCGRLVADLAAGVDTPLPAALTTPLRRFALPGLRRQYLRLAFAQYRLQDALSGSV